MKQPQDVSSTTRSDQRRSVRIRPSLCATFYSGFLIIFERDIGKNFSHQQNIPSRVKVFAFQYGAGEGTPNY
jgi:hypothetical protein